MSTPRTRHQNRTAAPQQKQSNPLARKIILIIVISVILCVISVFVNKSYPGILPNHTILKIVLLTIAVLIFSVVRFVIKQYKTLKNTYQNLEQNMQQSMMYGGQQIDYVEYPVNNQPMYPQQGYQQGYQQSYPQYNQTYNQQVPNAYVQQPQSRNRGSKFSLIVSIIFLSLLGVICFQLFTMINSVIDKGTNIIGYDCVAATVTKVSSYEYTEVDDDGNEVTGTEYSFDAVYEYKGAKYEITSVTRKKITENSTVYMYINPESPKSDRMTSYELSTKLIIYFSIAFSIELLLLMTLPFRLKSNSARPQRYR